MNSNYTNKKENIHPNIKNRPSSARAKQAPFHPHDDSRGLNKVNMFSTISSQNSADNRSVIRPIPLAADHLEHSII